ncbi:MAG: YbaB/EbfC family nucleoid-associated protein [Sciscionella sp.]|nr:YbaB/EbfC family nucleoid-associated protein [Sciscionella sp.]
MTDPTADRAATRERTAELHGQLDDLLVELRRRTAQIKEKQQRAFEVTGRAASPDGLVRATVDATGVANKVEFAPVAFDRSTPEQLATTVTKTLQEAAARARAQFTDGIGDEPTRGSEIVSQFMANMPGLSDIANPSPPSIPAIDDSAARSQSQPPRDAGENERETDEIDDDPDALFGGKQ